MTDLFSTPAEHAFEHEELTLAGPSTMGDATDRLSIEQAFEVEDTIRRIRDGEYKTVRAIQASMPSSPTTQSLRRYTSPV